MYSVTKSELVAALTAAEPDLRIADVEAVVLIIFETIASALSRGDRVEFRGFGVFSTKVQRARVARDHRNGRHVRVEQKIVPTFKSGRDLQQRINRSNQRGGLPSG